VKFLPVGRYRSVGHKIALSGLKSTGGHIGFHDQQFIEFGEQEGP
jgi:hypothetical protein